MKLYKICLFHLKLLNYLYFHSFLVNFKSWFNKIAFNFSDFLLLVPKIDIWTKFHKAAIVFTEKQCHFPISFFFSNLFLGLIAQSCSYLDVCIRLPRIASHKIMKHRQGFCAEVWRIFQLGFDNPNAPCTIVGER